VNFYLRGIAVSCSIFVAFYSVSSLAVCCVWRRVWRFTQRYSTERSADILFILRIAPFLVGTVITLAIAVPSFLLLEPRAIDEKMSGLSILLGLSGVAVVCGGIWRAAATSVRVSRAIACWSSEANAMESSLIRGSGNSVSMLRVSAFAPPLTASGILKSTLWVSKAAKFALTEQELETALRHEMVHVRRRDNLRKLILHLVAFPGMTKLEIAWHEATEMVADEAAVSSEHQALDLAEAMIKLSQISPNRCKEPTTVLSKRVMRLMMWTRRRQTETKVGWLEYSACVGAATVAMMVVTYGQLLVKMHEATEFLMR
jgi:beta-lactamase regulating signal transducer with metallopeptidase domain